MCLLFYFNLLFHTVIFTELGSDASQKTEMFFVLSLFIVFQTPLLLGSQYEISFF